MLLSVLLIILALLSAVLMVLRRKNADLKTGAGKELILGMTADQIREIRIHDGNGGILDLAREDGTWTDVLDPDIRIDQVKAGTLAASLTGIPVTARIQDVRDYGQYGLDRRDRSLYVRTVSGEETTLFIGDTNEMTLDVYCLKAENGNEPEDVFAVSTAVLRPLEEDAGYYAKEAESGAENMSGAEETAESGKGVYE